MCRDPHEIEIYRVRFSRYWRHNMKYAIISDIHANPAALERVLADAKQFGA